MLGTLRPYSDAWWAVHDEIEAENDRQLGTKLVICPSLPSVAAATPEARRPPDRSVSARDDRADATIPRPSPATLERGVAAESYRRRSRPRHIPSAGQFTIQGMPNLSTHMPKPLAQNVLLKGMVTVPPSASVLNLRSPSAGSATVSEIEKPCGL